MIETVYEHVAGDKTFTVTAAERWSINMIHRLASQHPDEVEIVHENSDGSLVAHVPHEWMRIKPKAKRSMTEEQREALRERMREMRSGK